MANQLDLEEQEQLDQLKHLWKQYGNVVTWLLIAVLAAFAGWNGYQYWQRSQATQAAAMFDELDRLSRQADISKVERAFNDMKDRYPRTTYAQQAGLLAAKLFHEAGKPDLAVGALTWVAQGAADVGYQSVAKLRLAAVLAESKTFDKALAQLEGNFPVEFQGLVSDRKGDIFSVQGKLTEARLEYEKAYKAMDERSGYRRLVEIKLNALGVNPQASLSPSAIAAPVVAASGVSK